MQIPQHNLVEVVSLSSEAFLGLQLNAVLVLSTKICFFLIICKLRHVAGAPTASQAES